MPQGPTHRKQACRVAVIGAGIVGLSVALELRSRGAEATVYDSGAELGAGVTMRAAGMLGIAFEWAEEDHGALAAFARHAGRLWPDFAARVERLGSGPVEYSAEGAIVVSRTVEEDAWLERLAGACQRRELAVTRLSVSEVRRIEPALQGGIRAALVLPDDRQVDAPLVLQRLGAALSRLGVAIRLGRKVERIVAGKTFQLPDGGEFDRIVLATGAGAPPAFVGPRGVPMPLALPEPAPVKGQMLAVAPMPRGVRHVLHARDVYIAPKQRWVLVGATSERGKDDVAVDRAAIAELRRRAAELVPTLATAAEVTAWAGVRPGSPDDAPLIGETAAPGVIAALGHYRNGVLFAPATAELVADLVLDGKVSPLAAAFSPRRFDKGGDPSHSPSASGLAR